MRKARIDQAGAIRCPRCGGTSFTRQRTLKGKVGFGLLAPKHTRCVACGTYMRQGMPKQMGAPLPAPAAGPPPGWFHDPNGQPVERWWDGIRWTEHTRDVGGAPPA